MATVAERINDYLTRRPVPLCDDCLAKAVGLSQRQHAATISQALGTTRDFNRYNGSCTDCDGSQKKVIARS